MKFFFTLTPSFSIFQVVPSCAQCKRKKNKSISNKFAPGLSIRGLARYSVYLTAIVLTKVLLHFLCILDPNPQAKKNAGDTAFQWCRLLVLFYCISPRKCCVCPEKVGKMQFVRVQLIQVEQCCRIQVKPSPSSETLTFYRN